MQVAINKKKLYEVLYHLNLKYSDLATQSNIQASLLYKYMNPSKYRCSINKIKSDSILDILNKNHKEKYKFDEIFYFYDKSERNIPNYKESE